MNGGILYLIGTVAFWVGLGCSLAAISCLMRFLMRSPGAVPADMQRGMLVNGLAGGILLLISRFLPMSLGRPEPEGFSVPLVWPLLPWTAWIAVGALVMVLLRAGQNWMAVSESERKNALRATAAWLLVFFVFIYFFRKSGDEVQIFRGAAPMSISFAFGTLALAVATIAAMAFIGRTTAMRGAGKKFATHLALIAGSVLFGIPFAWLLLTSVKEDRDIFGNNGFTWKAYVTQRRDYLDPEDRVFEGTYLDQRVEATLIEKSGDRVRLDVLKPMALRGTTVTGRAGDWTEIPKKIPLVTGTYEGINIKGAAIKELEGGKRRVQIDEPANLKGKVYEGLAKDILDVREPGFNWKNYPDAIDFLPPDTSKGLLYVKNTLILVALSVIGTVLSCTVVAYAFARLQFFGKNFLFAVLLSTMMLPAAVTMLPQFLIFRTLGWIDTLMPMWVPTFFAGAFNVFLLRQFFSTIPMELEDAAKIDGCHYARTLWQVMVPQIKPALAAISIFTAMGAWNNFMGPLIYISSPDKMPISYALQLYASSRGGEYGLVAAATTMSIIPVILLFFFAQKYFIEGVTLSGLGGR